MYSSLLAFHSVSLTRWDWKTRGMLYTKVHIYLSIYLSVYTNNIKKERGLLRFSCMWTPSHIKRDLVRFASIWAMKVILSFSLIIIALVRYIYIYIYMVSWINQTLNSDSDDWLFCSIYIVIHIQTVLLYHNSLVWLDRQDVSSWDRNPINFTLDTEFNSSDIAATYLSSWFIAHSY